MSNLEIGTNLGNYVITKYVSSGSFGDVYIGTDGKKLSAIKVPNQNELSKQMLHNEITIYKILNTNKLINCGISDVSTVTLDDETEVLTMEFLGESLDKKMAVCKKFNLHSLVCFAIRSIEIIFYIHSRGIVHRDIKPDNFLMTNDDKLYCVDFGISKRFLTSKGKHIPFHEGTKFKGTGRYASLAAHKCYEQSRKDDLESLGYVFVYLFKGKLPWQGYDKKKDKKKKYNYIMKQKLSITEDELCIGMPKQFSVYLKYVKSLDFEEKPRYTSLINMFKELL